MLKSNQEPILIIKDYYGFLSLTWLWAVLAPPPGYGARVFGFKVLGRWGPRVRGSDLQE